ncbi:MAG: serine hydrolase [Nitrospirota bacterium]
MMGTEHTQGGKKGRSAPIGRSQLLILLVLAFCLGVYVDRGIELFSGGQEVIGDERSAAGEGDYRYIRYAPRLAAGVRARPDRELKPFRYKVKALVEKDLKAGEAAVISVYFRDLRNGLRFGIGEQEKFPADSNLKLPLMIAYLKWAESSPLLLNRRFSYPAVSDVPAGPDAPQDDPEGGRMLKVRTLISRMVAENDSRAYAVLAANLPPAYLQRIFRDIYINYDPAKHDAPMSFSAYASFYRVLFNASYLNRDMSEQALRFLSQASYRDGIISGVPQDIDVVAKYGERIIDGPQAGSPAGMKQLHEVGIVYHPRRPYIMGVMVSGSDPSRLQKVMRDISTLIFEEVNRQG